MLIFVSPSNSLLNQYKASLDSTYSGAILNKVTFRTTKRTSQGSQTIKRKEKSKPKAVVDKYAPTKTFTKKSWISVSHKVSKDVTEKSGKIGNEKKDPIAPMKVVKEDFIETSIPKIIVRWSKKLKTKSKSSGVDIKDLTEEEAQQNRKKKLLVCELRSLGLDKRRAFYQSYDK